jgi:hypothetical protein
MPRKNPFVRIGRPPTVPSLGAGKKMSSPSPTGAFTGAIPSAAFSKGGRMPSYHDDHNLRKGVSKHGHCSVEENYRCGGKIK